MPLHDFECIVGHRFEAVVPAGTEQLPCAECDRINRERAKPKQAAGYEVLWLTSMAQKVFLRAPMGFVQRDICYDSPIDGRPITNKQARIEDLRRNNCEEYDPAKRQDIERDRREADAKLEAGVDASVDEFFATAPARKLEKLESELRAGASVEVTRPAVATT